MLCERGAELNQKRRGGETPLHRVRHRRHRRPSWCRLRLLMRAWCLQACLYGCVETVRFLIDRGAGLNATDEYAIDHSID